MPLNDRQIGALRELRRRGELDDRRAAALDELDRRAEVPSARPAPSRQQMIEQAGARQGRESGPGRAAALNVGAGVFGLGPRLSAAIDTARQGVSNIFGDTNDDFTYDEHLAFRRAETDAAASENPVAGYGAYLAGALTGGFGGARIVSRLAPRATAALTPRAGQFGRNVLRLGGAGAAGGAAQSAGEGEVLSSDPIEGAVVGAIASPVAAGAGKLLLRGLQRVGVATGVPAAIESSAFRHVVNGLRRYGETLPQTHARVLSASNRLADVLGRRPSAAELVEEIQPSAIRSAIETSPTATRRARELSASTDAGIPTALARRQTQGKAGSGVLRGRIANTPAALELRASQEFDRGITRIGDQQVPMTYELQALLSEPAVAKAIIGRDTGQYATRMRQALDNREETTVSISDIQTARKRLGDRIFGKTDYDEGVPEMRAAHELITATAARAPDGSLTEYGKVLRNFNWRKSMAEGFTEGRKILNEDDPAVFRSLYAAADRATQLGMRFGARSRIRALVGESSKGMEDDLRRLAQDPGLHDRLATVLEPAEIQDIIRAADIGHTLYIARSTSTPTTIRDRNRMAEMLRTGLEAGIMAKVGAGGAFMTGAIARAAGRLRIGEREAQRLAELAYDPANLPSVLEQLANRGLTPNGWKSDLNIAFRALPGQLAAGE